MDTFTGATELNKLSRVWTNHHWRWFDTVVCGSSYTQFYSWHFCWDNWVHSFIFYQNKILVILQTFIPPFAQTLNVFVVLNIHALKFYIFQLQQRQFVRLFDYIRTFQVRPAHIATILDVRCVDSLSHTLLTQWLYMSNPL